MTQEQFEKLNEKIERKNSEVISLISALKREIDEQSKRLKRIEESLVRIEQGVL